MFDILGVRVRLVQPLGWEIKFEMFEVRSESSGNFLNFIELFLGTFWAKKYYKVVRNQISIHC